MVARSFRQPVAQGVVAQESCKRPGKRLFVARRNQEAVVAIAQGFGNTADVRRRMHVVDDGRMPARAGGEHRA